MSILALTTAPHYLTIIPLNIKCTELTLRYNYIIIISTSFSIMWHLQGEPYGLLMGLDYLFAGIWGTYDFILALDEKNRKCFMGLIQILLLNCFMVYTNYSIVYDDSYVFYHSLWHIMSVAKCYYVSRFILS
jgi:hypothetical protein